jgi:hypothetical protein
MDAGFEYCGNSFEILNFVHTKNDDPYYPDCTFDLKVVSRRFAGYATGYELEYEELKSFIRELDDLYQFKTQKVELPGVDHQRSHVEFQMDKGGRLSISGTIWDLATFQSLEFSFEADQTILPPFISKLNNL